MEASAEASSEARSEAGPEGQEALSADPSPTLPELVGDGRAVLRISFDEMLDRSSPTVEVDDRTSYGAMRLTEVHDPARHPARIFFQDRSRPVLFYVGGDEPFDGMGQETVQAELGEPEAKLACRAGKEYAQWVYPATGVAVAVSRDRLAFLEVFPPTTLEEYRRTLYQEPGPFVR